MQAPSLPFCMNKKRTRLDLSKQLRQCVCGTRSLHNNQTAPVNPHTKSAKAEGSNTLDTNEPWTQRAHKSYTAEKQLRAKACKDSFLSIRRDADTFEESPFLPQCSLKSSGLTESHRRAEAAGEGWRHLPLPLPGAAQPQQVAQGLSRQPEHLQAQELSRGSGQPLQDLITLSIQTGFSQV